MALLLALPLQAHALNRNVRAFLISGAAGAVLGTGVGLVIWPISGDFRSIFIGTSVGLFLGLPGLVFGPFAGAVIGELATRPDWRHAGRVGLGTSLGLLLGIAAKIAVVFTMLGVFALAYLI